MDINTLPVVPDIAPGDPLVNSETYQMESTNSWLVDFLIHGKLKYLLEDNGINGTKAYLLIRKTTDAIKMCIDIFKTYCKNKDDVVICTFEALVGELEERLKS